MGQNVCFGPGGVDDLPGHKKGRSTKTGQTKKFDRNPQQVNFGSRNAILMIKPVTIVTIP